MCKLMKCNQYLSQGLLPPIDFLAKLLHQGKNEIHLPTFYIYNMKAIDIFNSSIYFLYYCLFFDYPNFPFISHRQNYRLESVIYCHHIIKTMFGVSGNGLWLLLRVQCTVLETLVMSIMLFL